MVERGSRSTALWWRSGGHGNLWQHGEVVVGRIPQDFNFLFSASRTFNKPGHLAIDDISFTNCSLPGKHRTVNTNKIVADFLIYLLDLV